MWVMGQWHMVRKECTTFAGMGLEQGDSRVWCRWVLATAQPPCLQRRNCLLLVMRGMCPMTGDVHQTTLWRCPIWLQEHQIEVVHPGTAKPHEQEVTEMNAWLKCQLLLQSGLNPQQVCQAAIFADSGRLANLSPCCFSLPALL